MSMPLEEKLYLIEQMKERANEKPLDKTARTGSSFEQESYEMMQSGFSWFLLRIFLCVCMIGIFFYCDKTDTKLFGISKTTVVDALEQNFLTEETIQTVKQKSQDFFPVSDEQ